MLAVKVTDWLTVEVLAGADDVSVMLDEAVPTACDTLPLLPEKFASPV